MKRRGRKVRKPKAPAAPADVLEASKEHSPSPNHSPHARSRRHHSRTPYNQESDDEYSDDELDDKMESFPNAQDQDFKSQCPRHQDMIEEYETMRTLYSHFPDERLQLLSHVISIIALHIVIFPFVNCFWTYSLSTQEDLMNLVSFITYNPKASFKDHLFEWKWVTLPCFNAEFVSFLLAVAVKDRLTKRWNRIIINVFRVENMFQMEPAEVFNRAKSI